MNEDRIGDSDAVPSESKTRHRPEQERWLRFEPREVRAWGGWSWWAGLVLVLNSGCEFGGGATPEAPAKPPEVQKLYAPPAPDQETPPASPASPSDTAEAEPNPQEQDNLRAALLGLGQEPPSARSKAPPRRRASPRPRRRAQPTESAVSRRPVEEAAVDTTPALSDGAFQSAITDWSGMKRCLASSAGRLDSSSGALRVKFVIRGDGQVVKSRVVETSNDVARAIAPCVEKRARRIRFPAFAQAADTVEKTAKFVF